MGLLASAISRSSGEKALSLVDLLRGTDGWRTSASGKVVNTTTALQVSTVLACTRVIGEGIAQVPLKLMKVSADGRTRTPEKTHPLYELLANRPNDWQTSFEYRETVALHAVLTGNHYSFVNRSNRSGIMELIPFEPGMVTVKRADDWTLTYEVRASNGATQIFPAKAIWHVKGPSWNSWMGMDAVSLARDAIGLAMAAEEQQAKMQRNGVRVSGTYSVEGTLADDQYKKLRGWIDANHAGSKNDGAAMIMDKNAKWQPMTMTGVDAQTIETRRFQIEEICRAFRVNPIMVGAESKNTTYASAEQMFLAHVVHCLSPWYMRLEQSIDANLLTPQERKDGLYSCFVDEGLLRGSLKDKHEMIRSDVNGGILKPNEGRALLDLPPDENPESNKLRIPANIAGKAPPKPAEETA
jgi:HK97 family phage portal protein